MLYVILYLACGLVTVASIFIYEAWKGQIDRVNDMDADGYWLAFFLWWFVPIILVGVGVTRLISRFMEPWLTRAAKAIRRLNPESKAS